MQLPAWARRSESDAADLTVLGALAFHFFVITRYRSLIWPDEIFQTVEQGHRLAFGYGVVPWEFRDGIRSWVLPGVLGAVMRATAFLGKGSAGYVIGLNFFLAVCSLAPVLVATAWARREKLAQPWLAGIATALWFELVFFSGKALTEVFAAYALPVALYYSIGTREAQQRRSGVLAGVAWGLTIGFRVHLAPAALLVMAWTCRTDLKRWSQVLLGFGGVLAVFGLVDWATWSYPFQSFFLNLWTNVVEGKAATFGVTPRWEYVASLLAIWGWSAIPLLGLAGVTFWRWPIVGWTALVILLTHSAIGHKEYRFLVPLLVILAVAAAIGLVQVFQSRRTVGWIACAALLAASADGARRYDLNDLAPRPPAGRPAESLWTRRGAPLWAFEALSTDDSVCGLAAVGVGWGSTGGYSRLHKNIALFDITAKAEVTAKTPFFNSVIASGENGEAVGPFILKRCWAELCLYQRPGPCEPPGDYTINGWLKATNM